MRFATSSVIPVFQSFRNSPALPDTQRSLRPPAPVRTSRVAEGEDEQKEEVWERRGREGAREDWKEGGRKEECGREGGKGFGKSRM